MPMSSRSLKRLVFLATLAVALVACGPVYRTEYSYVPPADRAGKQCLNQCLNMRAMCRSQAESRAANARADCERNAMINYTACMATAKSDSERSKCSATSYCSQDADTRQCEEEYRLCYENCGGTVSSYQVCEYGC
ncbi:membrane protein [Marichromatium purpuratum 984]|uniref:Membrane protein n=1 Tax=Marichromatium purpuratum 984 TaxID=765910 RepID=W0E7D9_MARPU|nr:hypothetical protein [Marichromatium purpuratum]AHF04986.1 membrane protein [Marichromatium purpuratum 984]